MAKDEKKALEYMKRAEECNLMEAFYMMGLMYSNGLIVEKNFNKALSYFAKAEDHGHAFAVIESSKVLFRKFRFLAGFKSLFRGIGLVREVLDKYDLRLRVR